MIDHIRKQLARRGFTLVEVAVAVIIMALTFSGLMTIIIMSRESEMVARNNLIASALNKEGFDMVRYIRDFNYHTDLDAFDGLMDTINEPPGPYNFVIGLNLSPSEEQPYYLNPAGTTDVRQAPLLLRADGRYGYNAVGGSNTLFRRLITTTYHTATGIHAPYIEVKVETHWREDNKQNVHQLVGQLSDWQ